MKEARETEREAFFYRDGWTCQHCGRAVGKRGDPATVAIAVLGKDIDGDRMRITLCIPCQSEHSRRVIALAKAKKVGLSRDTWELLFRLSQGLGLTLDRTVKDALEALERQERDYLSKAPGSRVIASAKPIYEPLTGPLTGPMGLGSKIP